jgi:PadR family transcriptional regulator PadR
VLYLGSFWLVARRSGFSVQTLSVLAVLCAQPPVWRHGYGIAKDTGLRSGTLYPILARLAERGLVEARWEEGQPAGRPRRHLYRLTADGLAAAEAALDGAPAVGRARAGSGRPRGRRVAPEAVL